MRARRYVGRPPRFPTRASARNDTLFKAAAALGQMVGAGLVDQATVEKALIDAARRHIGVEDFSTREARATIASGIARGRTQPRAGHPRTGERSHSLGLGRRR